MNNQPEIIVAKTAGFCLGVKKAIELADATLSKAKSCNMPVYTFGPLVHNPIVEKSLVNKGLEIIFEPDLPAKQPGFVIIRTHGVKPDIKEKIIACGHNIINATCPRVEKIHKIVRALSLEKYMIFIIGNKDHPEIEGITGYIGDNFKIIPDKNELLRGVGNFAKIGIIAQTTFNVENFYDISSTALKFGKEVRVFNTVCQTTSKRQRETLEISKKADLMLVVGGSNSSNTKRLYEICLNTSPKAYMIEDVSQVNLNWFDGAKRIGITGGASTPAEVIQGIVNYIESNA